MAHDHHHAHGADRKALLFSFIVITLFMIVEAAGGLITNSLALLSDAGHMLSDSISLGIGLLAVIYGARSADYKRTYGYKRFEILAAVFNGVTLIIVSAYIFYEAVGRFQHPPKVASAGMLWIAVAGLIVNIIVAWLLMRGEQDNLNIRAAFLHVIGDMLGSIGAIIAALLIMFFNLGIADPVASIIVAVLVLISGFRVTKEAVHILMEGTPDNVNMEDVLNAVKAVEGVRNIHDVHIWTITSGMNAMSCHVVVDGEMKVKESQRVQQAIAHVVSHHHIHHITVQTECESTGHEQQILCSVQPAAHEHHH